MNCKDHLHICQAECCKSYILTLTNPDKLQITPGKQIQIKKNCTADLIKYYKLHGCQAGHGILTITPKEYSIKGDQLTIYQRCSLLSEENTCKGHNTDKQPKICRYPNIEKHETIPIINITPNCVWHQHK